MEVCEICHQPIANNQPYKIIFWNRLAHLACYNKYFRLSWGYMFSGMMLLIFGAIVLLMGAIGVNAGDITDGFLSNGGDMAMFIVGLIAVILGIALLIIYGIKYFNIRKNPPLDK